jgi:hypothetical protein
MASWIVTKLTGSLATGTNGVDAFGSGDTSSVSGTSAGITMTPAEFLEPSTSVTFATAAIILTDGNTSHDLSGAGDGLTELAQNGFPNGERTEHASYWKTGEDTSVTVSWTESGPILASVGIADEVRGIPGAVTQSLSGDMPAATGSLGHVSTWFRTLLGDFPAASGTIASVSTYARTLTGTMGAIAGALSTVLTAYVAPIEVTLRFVWHDGDNLPRIYLTGGGRNSGETQRPPRRRRRLR